MSAAERKLKKKIASRHTHNTCNHKLSNQLNSLLKLQIFREEKNENQPGRNRFNLNS